MRYIRQEIFSEIGKKGQSKLRKSAVAVVGLGALGSVAAELLTRAGIRKLILVDRDIVEVSNLQRQALYGESDIGKPKAIAAKEKLNDINSEVKIKIFIDDLNHNNIRKIIDIENANLILDCTDNLETRFLINDFSIKNKVPFIHSSVVGSKGYILNLVPDKNNPCLRCFLKEAAQLDTCETAGVLNTITRIIPSIQVNEAIKILLGKDYEKNLLFFDVWKNELMKIKVNKNKKCECCVKNNFEYLSGKKSSKTTKMCGNDVFQIKNKSIDKKEFDNLKNRLKKIGKVTDFDYCVNFDNKLTIFQDGRALLKAKDEKEAKSLYSRFVGN
ncbi:MAG TPA: ThiF family adenylyltransferase [Candidatus Nanoarchaeia archaeon]|nr:ThiF family adenylyltransferase [Candidatus Nanoarchaeia archaeon]